VDQRRNYTRSASSGPVTFGDNFNKSSSKAVTEAEFTLLYLLRNYDLQSEIEKLLLYCRKEGVISLSKVVESLIKFFTYFLNTIK